MQNIQLTGSNGKILIIENNTKIQVSGTMEKY